MNPADVPLPTDPPTVSWLLKSNAGALALYVASLAPDGSRAFASVGECEHPAGMWLLTMYPRSRERQFVVYFPALEAARRAVELWAGQYWQSIEV